MIPLGTILFLLWTGRVFGCSSAVGKSLYKGTLSRPNGKVNKSPTLWDALHNLSHSHSQTKKTPYKVNFQRERSLVTHPPRIPLANQTSSSWYLVSKKEGAQDTMTSKVACHAVKRYCLWLPPRLATLTWCPSCNPTVLEESLGRYFFFYKIQKGRGHKFRGHFPHLDPAHTPEPFITINIQHPLDLPSGDTVL